MNLREVRPRPIPKAIGISRDDWQGEFAGALPLDVGLGALALAPGMHPNNSENELITIPSQKQIR